VHEPAPFTVGQWVVGPGSREDRGTITAIAYTGGAWRVSRGGKDVKSYYFKADEYRACDPPEPAPAPEKPAACPECGGTGGAHGTECPHRPSGEGSSCPDGCELWPVHENAEGVLIVYTLNDRTYRALDRMPSDARFCGRYWARSMRGEWMTALEAGETRMVLTPRGWELVDKTNAAQAEPPSHVAMRKEW